MPVRGPALRLQGIVTQPPGRKPRPVTRGLDAQRQGRVGRYQQTLRLPEKLPLYLGNVIPALHDTLSPYTQ